MIIDNAFSELLGSAKLRMTNYGIIQIYITYAYIT